MTQHLEKLPGCHAWLQGETGRAFRREQRIAICGGGCKHVGKVVGDRLYPGHYFITGRCARSDTTVQPVYNEDCEEEGLAAVRAFGSKAASKAVVPFVESVRGRQQTKREASAGNLALWRAGQAARKAEQTRKGASVQTVARLTLPGEEGESEGDDEYATGTFEGSERGRQPARGDASRDAASVEGKDRGPAQQAPRASSRIRARAETRGRAMDAGAGVERSTSVGARGGGESSRSSSSGQGASQDRPKSADSPRIERAEKRFRAINRQSAQALMPIGGNGVSDGLGDSSPDNMARGEETPSPQPSSGSPRGGRDPDDDDGEANGVGDASSDSDDDGRDEQADAEEAERLRRIAYVAKAVRLAEAISGKEGEEIVEGAARALFSGNKPRVRAAEGGAANKAAPAAANKGARGYVQDKQRERAITYVDVGECGRALDALDSNGTLTIDAARLAEIKAELNPSGTVGRGRVQRVVDAVAAQRAAREATGAGDVAFVPYTAEDLDDAVKRLAPHRAGGVTRIGTNAFKAMHRGRDFAEAALVIVNAIAGGGAELNDAAWDLINAVRVIAIAKSAGPSPAARSVQIGDLFLRVTSGLHARRHGAALVELSGGNLALARGGIETAVHAVATARRDKSIFIVNVDIKQAYPSLDQVAALSRVGHIPELAAFLLRRWGQATHVHVTVEGEPAVTLYTNNGTAVGDALSTGIFCATVAPVFKAVQEAHVGMRAVSFADDSNLFLNKVNAKPVLVDLERELWARCKLTLQPVKSTALVHDDAQAAAATEAGVPERAVSRTGTLVCKVPVGDDDYVSGECMAIANKAIALLHKASDLARPRQGEAAASTQGLSHAVNECIVSRYTHVMRCVPRELCGNGAAALDGAVDDAHRRLLDVPSVIVDPVALHGWERSHLPVRHSGLGFVTATDRADAAYIGGLAMVVPTVRELIVGALAPPPAAEGHLHGALAPPSATPPRQPPPLVVTELVLGPYYDAVIARLAAAGASQKQLDRVSPAALATARQGCNVQRALTSELMKARRVGHTAQALAVAASLPRQRADEAAAMERSLNVPHPAFAAKRSDAEHRMKNNEWSLACRALTQQELLTESTFGKPPPVDAGGRQRCPYSACRDFMTAQGTHAHSCKQCAPTTACHDAMNGALLGGLKKAAGSDLLVSREPRIFDDAADLGGRRRAAGPPGGPAVYAVTGEPRADGRLFNPRTGDLLLVDFSIVHPCSIKYITEAKDKDGAAADKRVGEKKAKYEEAVNDASRIMPLVFETGERMRDGPSPGFLVRAARLALGVPEGSKEHGAEVAGLVADLRVTLSVVFWRGVALKMQRLINAVRRRIDGGGLAYLPAVGLGARGGGVGAG